MATFTLYFTGLDSFQMLLLQDAVEEDKYIGKLKIISSNNSFQSELGTINYIIAISNTIYTK